LKIPALVDCVVKTKLAGIVFDSRCTYLLTDSITHGPRSCRGTQKDIQPAVETLYNTAPHKERSGLAVIVYGMEIIAISKSANQLCERYRAKSLL